jgi:transcriptional regulator GlxA family with amidase domain
MKSIVFVLMICLTSVSDSQAADRIQRTIGVLLFPGVQMLDATGPMEMWGNLKGQITIATVASKKGPIPSSQGPQLVADYSFEDCPKLDLLLVPGGFSAFETLKDKATLDWLRMRSEEAEITMSVCNGASILAAAGLLDGRKATTNKAYWTASIASGPKVHWVRKARWVDDGDIVTSSGVSAGMDMTLHVIERLFGTSKAESIAKQTEYEWHRDSQWDPFADLPEMKSAKNKKK